MSEEPQKPQESTSKVNDKVQAAKETTKNVTNATLNKADEPYNKLPLDKLNEKLKGKVDVKSRKFKRILGGSIAVLLILLLWFSCHKDNSTSKPTFHFIENQYFDYYSDSGLAFLKSLRPCYREWDCTFTCLCELSDKGLIKARTITEHWEGKTASECMAYTHKNWGEEGDKLYKELIDKADSKKIMQGYEYLLDHYVELNQHYRHIQENFVGVFNQRLGEIHSDFKVLSLEVLFKKIDASWENDEIWGGKCKLQNTITGAEFSEVFACMISWDNSGDKKYETRSYDRPIKLDWYMLHDIGDGNYLNDPRY